jgi:hypothetical protein
LSTALGTFRTRRSNTMAMPCALTIAGILALFPSMAWATDDNLALQLGTILG